MKIRVQVAGLLSKLRAFLSSQQFRDAVSKEFLSSKEKGIKVKADRTRERPVITWCRAFNKRNGYIVPAKSAESIFYKSVRRGR